MFMYIRVIKILKMLGNPISHMLLTILTINIVFWEIFSILGGVLKVALCFEHFSKFIHSNFLINLHFLLTTL